MILAADPTGHGAVAAARTRERNCHNVAYRLTEFLPFRSVRSRSQRLELAAPARDEWRCADAARYHASKQGPGAATR